MAVTNRPSSKYGGTRSAEEYETDMHSAAATGSTPRTDTRSRAQKVALELFAEQGYEKTSLLASTTLT